MIILYVASVKVRILARNYLSLNVFVIDDDNDANILLCMKLTALDSIIDWLSINGNSCMIYVMLQSIKIVRYC